MKSMPLDLSRSATAFAENVSVEDEAGVRKENQGSTGGEGF